MDLAKGRSARRFFVGRDHVPVEKATPVVTFHRDFLVTLGLRDDNEMGKYLDRFAQGLGLDNDPRHKYFWAYNLDGPSRIEVFRYDPSEVSRLDAQTK